MADKRIRDLDAQSARVSGLKIPVDFGSFDETKQIDIATLAPLISELTAHAVTNRATNLIPFSIGGTEYNLTLNDIYTLIKDLTEPPTSLTDGTLLRVDISGNGTETKKSLSNIATFISNHSSVLASINGRISAQADAWENIALYRNSTIYGHLYLYKFGRLVTGMFLIDQGAGVSKVVANDVNGAGSPIVIKTGLVPAHDVHCSNTGYDSSSTNHIYLKADGSVEMAIGYASAGAFPSVSISYYV